MAEITTVELMVDILYGTLTGFLFIFGADILARYLKADKQQRGDATHLMFFVMGIGLIAYGIYMITVIARVFVPSPPDWVGSILNVTILFVASAFALTAEQFVFPKKTRIIKIGKRGFGIISLLAAIAVIAMVVLTIIEFINPTDYFIASLDLGFTIPYLLVTVFLVLVAFYGFVQILIIRLSLPKEIKRKLVLGLFSGMIALVGEFISLLGRNPPDILWVIGTLVEIGGFVFFRFFFLSIPPYSELDWKNGIIEIHVIMADTGLSLFHRLFHRISPEALKGELEVTTTIPERVRPDSDLTGGAMIGIKGLLSEIAGTKGRLRNIVIGEKNLIFNQGENVMVLLLADQNLGVYHSILYKTAREIEDVNKNLANFDGNLKNLQITPIIDKYFGSIQTENSAAAKK